VQPICYSQLLNKEQNIRRRKGNSPVGARNSNNIMNPSTATTCKSIKSTLDAALKRKRVHEAIQSKPNQTEPIKQNQTKPYTDGLWAGKGSNGHNREKDYTEEKNITE
jgi:hypothetical protein